MTSTLRDLLHAGRLLRRSPGFSATVLLTLAVGIGATVAVFGMVEGILLRPLPFPDAERLYMLWQQNAQGSSFWFSAPNYEDVRDRVGAFSGVAAFSPERYISSGAEEPERVAGADVTANFFDVLGVDAVAGRIFTEADALQPVAVIEEGYWRRQFGGSPEAVGATLRIDGSPVQIVGVVPAGPLLPTSAEVWMPLNMAQPEWRQRRGIGWIQVVARLAPGTTLEAATDELRQLGADLAAEYPDSNEDVALVPESLLGGMVEDTRTPLLAMMGTVALVLLIVCVNVAGLLLARAEERRDEVAIRFALGGGRAHIFRQFLVESVTIAAAGGLLGLFVAYAAVRMLVALAPPETPRLEGVGLDAGALAFCMAVTLGVGVAFGLVPALRAARLDARGVGTADLSRRASEGTAMRSGLVVAQVALAVVLTVGASLLLKSLWRVSRVDPGFDTRGLLTVGLPLVESEFASNPERWRHYRAMQAEVDAVPGVLSTALGDALPLRDSGRTYSFELRQPADPGAELLAGFRVVTPGYFETLGIDVVEGRSFVSADDAGGEPVVIVDETFARRHFGDGRTVGEEILLMDEWRRVVGVVAAIRDRTLEGGPAERMYVPLTQSGGTRPTMVLVVRAGAPAAADASASGPAVGEGTAPVAAGRERDAAATPAADPLALLPAVRAAVRRVDPDQVLALPASMADWVNRSLSTSRFTTLVLTFFGASALLLAALGIYGMLAYSVRRRAREIGIRMAVGAAAAEVRNLVVRQGALLTLGGVVLGLMLAAGATRVVEARLGELLYEVPPRDPVVFASVALLLLAVALVAAWLPARRATRIDPVKTLRLE